MIKLQYAVDGCPKGEKERLMLPSYYSSTILYHLNLKNCRIKELQYRKRMNSKNDTTKNSLFYRPDADAGKSISLVHIAQVFTIICICMIGVTFNFLNVAL